MTNKDLYYQHLGLPSTQASALEIVDAEGIYLTEKSGKKYIDLVSGVSVNNIGHKNSKIIEAVQRQAADYMHLMVYGEFVQSPQVQLAKMLSDRLPEGLDVSYFVNSGSEAIEGALKLAKRYTGRSEMIAFRNAYHGGTHGALSILGNERLKSAFRPLLPDIRFLDFNVFEQLNKITEKTACVIVESIQAEAGIILPAEGYLKALQKRCNETGTLLILDDIQMGFGRTGKLFSFENYEFVPDILCLAKAMGGGMPIGAFVSSLEMMRSLTFQPELGHITTFGGHPVNCAAAIANIEFLEENDIVSQVNEKGRLFVEALKNHTEIQSIRRQGLMLGLDVKHPGKMNQIMDNFLHNGLIVDRFLFRSTAFRIAPPLTIKEKEIEEVIEKVLRSLDV
jgi:acetylornithine/succinyldiaminopimelate/putrescine aminotransferase